MTVLFSGLYESALGPLSLVWGADRALWASSWDEARTLKHLRRHAGEVSLMDAPIPPQLSEAFDGYFAGQWGALSRLVIAEYGTAFQRALWLELRTCPPGQTWTYAALARRIGRPQAARAVGAALGANPLLLVNPCHRVVGSTGQLTGFAGGVERKAWLLAHEAAL